MRVAALYDIHGNLPALEAVMEEVRQAEVERIVVGGDVVLGPMPREMLAYLLDLDIPVQFVRGNCDTAIEQRMAGIDPDAFPAAYRELNRWVASQLQPEYEGVFADWPLTVSLKIEGLGEVLFCHATPRDENEIFTCLTPEAALLPVFDGLDAAVVVCGHTHMQFDRMIGKVRVVNAGSVGTPFGEPGADWLLIDSEIQFRHTPYDLAKAAERIRATTYPQAAEFADHDILQPSSAAEKLELYTRMGLK